MSTSTVKSKNPKERSKVPKAKPAAREKKIPKKLAAKKKATETKPIKEAKTPPKAAPIKAVQEIVKSDKPKKIPAVKEMKPKKEKAAREPSVVEPETMADAAKKNHPPTENNPDIRMAREVLQENLGIAMVKSKIEPLKKQPQSMEELLAVTGYRLQGLKKSQEVAATITDKSKRGMFFDIGAKTEGVLLDKEVEYISDYMSFLQVGDTVNAIVVSPENEKGQILLSLSRSADQWRWRLFDKYKEMSVPIDVRGLDINRGGMIARVLNVRGFIPVSQFGRQWVGKLDQLYNKVFAVKIIEVDREKNRLIFSEKAVSESEMMGQQQDLLSKVKPGDRYKGQVSGVMPFGIFVRVLMGDKQDADGIFLDGLVHISEISWEKVNDVSKLYKMSDLVDVEVLDIDENSGKLNLSIKRLSDDPWTHIAKKYPVESKTKGTITRLAAYGAFVELENGIEGLIHISKIPSDQEIKVGQEVQVYIETIDIPTHRISLGMVLTEKPVGYK